MKVMSAGPTSDDTLLAAEICLHKGGRPQSYTFLGTELKHALPLAQSDPEQCRTIKRPLRSAVRLLMKYSLTFALLGALICYWAVSHGDWWYLLLWLAFSFFTLSVGYGGVGPRIFCKQPDGTIPLWVRIVHFPFLFYAEVVWHITQKLSRENPFDKVRDDLILGRRLRANELPPGILNYVDLTAEFEDPEEIRQSTNYISLPILDAGVPSVEGLIVAISRLHAGTTYVHCAQGHGRTGLFALAWLSTRGYVDSFEDGFAILKGARPGIALNKTQERFIKNFIAEQWDAAGADAPHH